MVKVNRDAYLLAQTLISEGFWSVDLDAGHVIGSKGVPLTYRHDEGYILCRPTQRWKVMVHRVLWEFASGQPIPDALEVNHINGIKGDNRLANLELVTHTGNMRHARETGLIPPPHLWPKPAVGNRSRVLVGCRVHGFTDWGQRGTRPGGFCRICNRRLSAASKARRKQPQ